MSSGSDSDSDVQLLVDGVPVKPRPKLRTRRVIAYSDNESDGGSSVHEVAALSASKMAERDDDFELDDEDVAAADAQEEADDDELDADDAYEQEAEEVDHRRSSRVRRRPPHVSPLEFDYIDDSDDSDPRPARLAGRKQPAKRRRAPVKRSGGRKRPRRERSDEDESESDVTGGSDDYDDDVEFLATVKGSKGKQSRASSDDENEKAFTIDKLLAREVHTAKEWAKICAGKTTRFLQNCSIFLPDEDDEEAEAKGDAKENGAEDGATAATTTSAESSPEQEDVEKFLVKWKSLSYLHASWETEADLLDVDKAAKGKLQRFREKEAFGLLGDASTGDEYFNPEFRIVDRVLDIQDQPGDDFAPAVDADDSHPKLRFFLIKWKAQAYDQITWEREDDVNDDAAVREYEERLLRAAGRYRKHTNGKSNHRKKHKTPKFRAYTATVQPPKKASQTFELREYQLTGVNWLLFNWYQRRNSLLADEMGLGKTVQTVMYINHLAVVEELPNPFLIIAPLSTLSHWQREFVNWTDLNAVVYHGSAEARNVLQTYEFFLSADDIAHADQLRGRKSNGRAPPQPKRNCYRFDVLITSYEMCSTNDFSKLSRIPWQLLVVDEAHRLKNRSSKLSSILHKNFSFESMLLLTGTPLQNNVEELWTLLNFLDGDRFASKIDFLERFGELKDSTQVEQLHGELKPFLLRRMKEDVEKSLAPKEETIIEVELTVLQKQYYRAIYEKNTEFLARGGKKGNAPSLMNIMMELRKCCNHAFLIKGAEEREVARLRQQKDLNAEERERLVRESLVLSSGKLVLLDKLLPRLQETGHRVLIFSQFKIMLDILQDYLRLRQYRCERIDGGITGNDRQSAIDRFCDPDSPAFIMLLSTRAGGVGINLTAADTVIIYDSDWNPQNDLQAQARCHRIGQKKSVKIYRLLSPKTYELHMFHQASLKLGLDQAILGGIRGNNSATALTKTKAKTKNAGQLSKEEIENLLKHGAYEMFKEEKDGEAEAASKRFSEESIDQILSRSTTIVHDPTKGEDGDKKSLMSSFSKATFVSSSNPDEVVDIDDPDFWTKVIGLEAVEAQKPVEASPLKKRRCRRRVKTYLEEQQEDSDDARSNKRKRGAAVSRLEEEYVISDDESASDSDDDDDDLVDGDFAIVDGKKRRKRSESKPVLPSIYQYSEALLDMLMTYGYGRWEEVQKHHLLGRYPIATIKKFTHEFLVSCLRLAAAPTMAHQAGVELMMFHIYSTPSIPATADGMDPPAERLSLFERLGVSLDKYCAKFRFVPRMLKEMGVSRVSGVGVPKPLRRDLPVPTKGDRNMPSKLQQIDRLFVLTHFVRARLGSAVPIAALVGLINDFQHVGDAEAVRSLIRSNELPPLRSNSASPAVKTTTPPPSVSTPAQPAEMTGSADPTEKLASPSSMSSAAASEAVSSVVTSSSTATENTPMENGNAASASGEPTDPIPRAESDPATSVTIAVTPSPTPVDGEKPAVASAPSQEPTQSNDSAPPTTANASSDTTEAASTTNSSSEQATTSSNDTCTPSPSPTAVATPQSPRNTPQRRAALRTLQSLLDVRGGEGVAPWWISLVDDVLLLLYIYRDGWIKGRLLPDKLVRQSSLFGARASTVALELWPTVAMLNKRAKTLIAAWMPVKAPPKILPPLPTTTSSAGHSHLQQRETTMANGQPARNIQGSAAMAARGMNVSSNPQSLPHLMDVPPPGSSLVVSDQDRDMRMTLMASKHNQFAKLVFSFGIPDTSACRTPAECREKWRYFIHDTLLALTNTPLEQLQAEAADLERACRSRLRNRDLGMSGPVVDLAMSALHLHQRPEGAGPSILGGDRGFWMLTTTQCRRLVTRVDLFRLLRSKLLVLPPAQLKEIVSRVLKAHVARGTAPTFPAWWKSPVLDVLLLQGVECYGLDDHLAHVWKLPQFQQANAHGLAFPSGSWVENYVSALAKSSNRMLDRVNKLREQQAGKAVGNPSATTEGVEAKDAKTKVNASEPRRESETVQRVHDIAGMRLEDPHFTVAPRLRQLVESNEAAKRQKESTMKKIEAVKQGDNKVREQTVGEPEKAMATNEEGGRIHSEVEHNARDQARGSVPEVRELEYNEWRGEQTDLSESRRSDAAKPRSVASTADNGNDNEGGQTTPAPKPVAPRTRRTPPSPPSQRKRALRSWDVIVIDDSDDDE